MTPVRYSRSNPAEPEPSHADRNEGCAEQRLLLSRRAMLGVTAGLFSWGFTPRYAEAAASDDPRLLVVVLRGGIDGLSTVVPFGDSQYAPMRGELAFTAASTLRLNSFFGAHPALKNFYSYYRAGEAAVVHATCVPLRNRSHFDGQENLENGLPGLVPNASGWLNRLLTALPAGAPIRESGAIEIGEAPAILRGPAPVLGWSPTNFVHLNDPTLTSIRTLYRARDPKLLAMLDLGLQGSRLAESLGRNELTLTPLRNGFRGAGKLLGAADGPRIAVLSVGGWDTHADQGGPLNPLLGPLAENLTELDLGLADFKLAAGASWSQTVMVLVTEFGRTVRVNGDSGTDHGVGTVALLAGGAVNGGRIFGDWPGLALANLYEGTGLTPTTDLRSVFKGVLRDHLSVPSTILETRVFPGSGVARPLANLIKSSARATLIETPAGRTLPNSRLTGIAEYRANQLV